jgi:hypothetical protein
MGDEGDDSCSITICPLQSKLPQHAAVKPYKNEAILVLLETILGNTNTEFNNSSGNKSNTVF